MLELFVLGLIATSVTFGLSTLFGAFTWDNLAVGIMTALVIECVGMIALKMQEAIGSPAESVYKEATPSYPDTDDIPADPDMRVITRPVFTPSAEPLQATLFGTWEPVRESVGTTEDRPAGVPANFVFRDGFWVKP